MKKKLLASMLVSATVLGIFATGGTALAAETDKRDSEVGIGFTDHIPGETPGPLEIKWAPIKLDFGTTNNTTQTTFNEKSGVKKYVVVNDTRNGATDKWDLKVNLGNLMSGPTQLTGAQLKFDAAKQGYTGTDAPEAPGSIVAPTGSAAVSAGSFTLNQGDPAVSAMADAGPGTYQGFSALEMDNITLDVPSNAANAGKQFTGKLTWSLNDTP
ncbi:MAG: WxL domain-containing protein [Enterococcus sp.]